MGILITAINLFFQVVTTLIVIYCLLSWFAMSGGGLSRAYMRLGDLLEPLIAPWRSITRGLTYRIGIDFAPVLAIFALEVINTLIVRVLIRILY